MSIGELDFSPALALLQEFEFGAGMEGIGETGCIAVTVAFAGNDFARQDDAKAFFAQLIQGEAQGRAEAYTYYNRKKQAHLQPQGPIPDTNCGTEPEQQEKRQKNKLAQIEGEIIVPEKQGFEDAGLFGFLELILTAGSGKLQILQQFRIIGIELQSSAVFEDSPSCILHAEIDIAEIVVDFAVFQIRSEEYAFVACCCFTAEFDGSCGFAAADFIGFMKERFGFAAEQGGLISCHLRMQLAADQYGKKKKEFAVHRELPKRRQGGK